MFEHFFSSAKSASVNLALIDDTRRSKILAAVADAIESHQAELLAANAIDLKHMDKDNPLYDRLQLTEQRLAGIASDMRHVGTLPSPLGRILSDKILDNGLHLQRVSVPFGVIGIIYEARPNVTFDVFSLCFKSGNACILKGGKDADNTNIAAVKLIHDVLKEQGIDYNVVQLLPATHEAAAELLHATQYVDLIIPRGSSRLIRFVREEAKVPCIETGAGVVNTYFDEYGDTNIGKQIILNAKTRRPSVCNALDCLIIHRKRLSDLPELCSLLLKKQVELFADTPAYSALQNNYPSSLLHPADSNSYGTEYMSLRMAVRTVNSLEEALSHIARYGSGHSECIITENKDRARVFQTMVDAACVYVNAPTSFTDGGQFGLGAEIGISTQKLGARGPMGLEEITTYKWLITGHGQTRPA
ncbi:MAG TPA: glutamate-5-semialdehyde dehydrogenase [Prevotellaceae bacterium]|nr:glutamate-5-semialdehyde dehydrogenase [Prevotellaceae bacterium]